MRSLGLHAALMLLLALFLERGPQLAKADAVFSDDSLPKTMVKVTPDTLAAVGSGYWFLDHYSPGCPHCKEFAPYWHELVANLTDTSAGSSWADTHNLKFGIVNYICVEHGVSRFPGVILFRDGKSIDVFSFRGKSDTAERLKVFVQLAFARELGLAPETTSGTEPAEPVRAAEAPGENKGVSSTTSGEALFSIATANPVDPAGLDTVKGDPDHFEAKAREGDKIGLKDDVSNVLGSSEKSETGKSETAPEQTSVDAKDLPNAQGASLPLNGVKFSQLISQTMEPYFVKFYVPWCSHCKHIAQAWTELATAMKGQLNIAEVNCDQERALCKDLHLKGYPSLLFFKNGQRVEYEGMHGFGDLLAFARKAAETNVADVNVAVFEELRSKHDVVFLYMYDGATSEEDFEALSRASIRMVGDAPIVKSNSNILAIKYRVTSFPRLIVVRDDRATNYDALGPAEMRDIDRMTQWMMSVRLPIVAELSTYNARELMYNSFAVLGILDRNTEAFSSQLQILKDTAYEYQEQVAEDVKREKAKLRKHKQKQVDEASDRGDKIAARDIRNTRITVSERPSVRFAWVDAVFWGKWLKKTYNIEYKETGPRVIVTNERKGRYWDKDAHGNPLIPAKEPILEALPLITTVPPKLSPESTVGGLLSTFYRLSDFVVSHPLIMVTIAVLQILVLIGLRKRLMRITRGTTSRMIGTSTLAGEEGGSFISKFLHTGPGGKAD